MLVLLALAIGPGLIILHVVWAADRHREPVLNVLAYVMGGAVILQAAGLLESLAGVPDDMKRAVTADPAWFVVSMFIVGVVEEAAKFWAVWRRGVRDKQLDEPFDWLVYTVAVSLGFGTLENIMYVARGGVGVALARAFTAVPVHALCGTLMGIRLAKATRVRDATIRSGALVLAVLEPAAWHGMYDALCGFMGTGSGGAAFTQLILLAALWTEGYRRTRDLRNAYPDVPTPPILLPEEVLERRRRRGKSRRDRRLATSLAAAMRGDIPADAPARVGARPSGFEHDEDAPQA